MTSAVAAPPDITLAFAVTPLANGARVCFAARRSGLYRSVDHGETWTAAAGTAGAGRIVTAVAISPEVSGDRTVVAGTAGGVLRSPDLGETWQSVPFGAPPPLVSALAISPAGQRDGVMLAGTVEDGLYRSSDRGASWRLANPGLLDMSVLAIAISPAFAEDQTVLLGAASGVYLSRTGGRSWRDLDGPEAPVVSVAISPRFTDDRLLLAGTEGAGLVLSRDGGEHWSPVASFAESDIVSSHFVADATRPDILVVTPDGVFRSEDGGATWNRRATDLPPEEAIVAATVLDDAGTEAMLLVGLASGAIRRAVAR